jgi:hypothetical protein
MQHSTDNPYWLPVLSTIACITTISGAKLDKFFLHPKWMILLAVCISVIIWFVVREPFRTVIYALIAITNFSVISYLSFIARNYSLLTSALFNLPLLIIVFTVLLLLLVILPIRKAQREVMKHTHRTGLDLSSIDESYDEGHNDYIRSQYDDDGR